MFYLVTEFESKIAEYFGSPYAVATDCCTHAIELCLRLQKIKKTSIPNHTYLSIPMTLQKLDIDFSWNNQPWQEYYVLGDSNIIDAAVLWREKSYIPNTFMCLSFQFKKHLNLGRGGMILLDDVKSLDSLIKMSYDGRNRIQSWAEQSIDTVGYHYYMTPETARIGIEKLSLVKSLPAKQWTWRDYPDLSDLKVFSNVK